MHISSLTWQSLTIEYPFSTKPHTVRFFDFQPKAKKAIEQLILNPFGSALILKTEIFPEFLNEIEAVFAQQHNPTISYTDINRYQLFGYHLYVEKENRVESVQGVIQQAHQKILILNIHSILLDITLWDKLKHALLFGQFEPITRNALPYAISPIQSEFKLVLVGSREDISTLYAYDESLYQFCQYSEIDSSLQLNQKNTQLWGDYVQTLASQYLTETLTKNALNSLLKYFIRESENSEIITISPTLLKKHLLGIQNFSSNQPLEDKIDGYFSYLEQQSSALTEYMMQDILNHQIYIETEGENIGQINGLSVVEFDGVPHSFGEPLRISCNVQYGDGEIHDIERKVELCGNSHSKGILIAQSCLANLLELPTQLPFSATLAFEQSYGEIDGDSSSLAIFCVLISALSKLPLPQSIALTGAIDQFGNVLSVGGINQKIEGFFNLCQARQLNGKQGVIIPAVSLAHLSLKQEVVAAIKAGQFTIWAVSDVFEATTLLLNKPFYAEENAEQNEQESIFDLIHRYIDEAQEPETSGSFFQKFCKWACRN